jgi:hypothetical protein
MHFVTDVVVDMPPYKLSYRRRNKLQNHLGQGRTPEASVVVSDGETMPFHENATPTNNIVRTLLLLGVHQGSYVDISA